MYKARKIRNQFMIDNPTINNKSKIGTGKNNIDTLNKQAKSFYNENQVEFSTYKYLSSEEKKKK